MFLRHTKRKKDGKEHRYWSIVENRRIGGGRVVQRPLLYLGEINDLQELALAQVNRHPGGRGTASRERRTGQSRDALSILGGTEGRNLPPADQRNLKSENQRNSDRDQGIGRFASRCASPEFSRHHLSWSGGRQRCSKTSTVAVAMRAASGIASRGRSPTRSRATSANSRQV
jgi:hypothetical protein